MSTTTKEIRNYVKKHMDIICKPKVQKDKSKYSRKDKHKGNIV